jgi:hypothetical protein
MAENGLPLFEGSRIILIPRVEAVGVGPGPPLMRRVQSTLIQITGDDWRAWRRNS